MTLIVKPAACTVLVATPMIPAVVPAGKDGGPPSVRKLNPGGSEPLVIDHVYPVPVPPVAVKGISAVPKGKLPKLGPDVIVKV